MASSRDVDRTAEAGRPAGRECGGRGSPRRNSPFWSVVLAVVFASTVGSCCLCSGLLYRQRPQFLQDPATAATFTRQMLSIDIPESFTPQGTINWHVPFLLTMRGAYFSQSVSTGELTLLEVNSQFIEQPEFRRHIIESLRQHGAGSGFDLNVLQTETKVFQIGQEPVEFEFLTAEDRTTGKGRRLVDGVVAGTNGPVLVSLWVDEEIWDAEQVTRMIESIDRTPQPPDER
ncbi:MAG: hypothetical protein AB7U20_06180 [Planctomycetaceae bacterium]